MAVGFCLCIVKRTKINKNRPGLAHIKESFLIRRTTQLWTFLFNRQYSTRLDGLDLWGGRSSALVPRRDVHLLHRFLCRLSLLLRQHLRRLDHRHLQRARRGRTARRHGQESGTLNSVWPDLAKPSHFGKNFNVLGKFWEVYWGFCKVMNLLWQILDANRQFLIVLNDQILKNNPIVWSHWLRQRHFKLPVII